jgi:hypothetical protein
VPGIDDGEGDVEVYRARVSKRWEDAYESHARMLSTHNEREKRQVVEIVG